MFFVDLFSRKDRGENEAEARRLHEKSQADRETLFIEVCNDLRSVGFKICEKRGYNRGCIAVVCVAPNGDPLLLEVGPSSFQLNRLPEYE